MMGSTDAFVNGLVFGLLFGVFWGMKLLAWMIEKDWMIYEKRKPKQ